MKHILCCILILVLLLVGCAPGDITDDIYFDQIYATQIGSPTNNVTTGYFHDLYVDNNTLYIGGVPFSGNGTEKTANKGVAGGYASLNATGKIPLTHIDFPSSTAIWGAISGTLSNQGDLQTALDAKQATLVSGTNIKTINGTSILGSGDLVISAGDHNHTADNITGGSANQTILSVNGRGSWTALLMEHISGLVAALAGKVATTQAAVIAALGYTPADNVTAVAHYGNVSNPHSVTKTQVGLANVSNVAQADNVTAQAHYTNTSNPHSTTAAQAGALPTGNVSVTAGVNKVPSANGAGTIAPNYVPTFTSSAKGAVPASGGGTSNFLRADGTFAAPPGGSTTVWKRITANSATTSTSLVEIADLYVALEANSVYLIQAGWNETVSAVTTGIRFGASFNGTLTAMALQITGTLANTTGLSNRISANNTATTGLFITTSGSTVGAIQVTGVIRTGASGGNFVFKHLKVTSGTATALADGWILATKQN